MALKPGEPRMPPGKLQLSMKSSVRLYRRGLSFSLSGARYGYTGYHSRSCTLPSAPPDDCRKLQTPRVGDLYYHQRELPGTCETRIWVFHGPGEGWLAVRKEHESHPNKWAFPQVKLWINEAGNDPPVWKVTTRKAGALKKGKEYRDTTTPLPRGAIGRKLQRRAVERPQLVVARETATIEEVIDYDDSEEEEGAWRDESEGTAVPDSELGREASA